MAKKCSENPQLDMTPMIDVVFELIIFFVVTLRMAVEKDKTVELEDGTRGIPITEDELPPSQLTIDIAKNGRISICDITMDQAAIRSRVRDRKRKFGSEFPVMIRADKRAEHRHVKAVMDACTMEGVWKLSIVAIGEHRKKDGKNKKKSSK